MDVPFVRTAFEQQVSIPLGVVVAATSNEYSWQSLRWRPLAVFLHAQTISRWRRFRNGGTVEQYHAATLPLKLTRSQVAGYTCNLKNGVPSIYVGMSEQAGVDGPPAKVELVAASPFEIEAFGGMTSAIVSRVPMPPELRTLVAAFVDNTLAPHMLERRDPRLHLKESRFAYADLVTDVPALDGGVFRDQQHDKSDWPRILRSDDRQ